MRKRKTPMNLVDVPEAAPLIEAQKDRAKVEDAARKYQINAIYQTIRTMQRTPEGRAALAAKKEELQARGILKRGT